VLCWLKQRYHDGRIATPAEASSRGYLGEMSLRVRFAYAGAIALAVTLIATVITASPGQLQAGESSSQPSATSAPQLSVELNKLEAVDKGCRVYTVVDNPGQTVFEALKLDLILFHTDGVIGRRLMLDLAPIKSSKKTVKMFDLDGTACDKIGSFLVHDVMECKSDKGPVEKCLDAITLKSLSNVQISK
jgi:hypothetical protein